MAQDQQKKAAEHKDGAQPAAQKPASPLDDPFALPEDLSSLDSSSTPAMDLRGPIDEPMSTSLAKDKPPVDEYDARNDAFSAPSELEAPTGFDREESTIPEPLDDPFAPPPFEQEVVPTPDEVAPQVPVEDDFTPPSFDASNDPFAAPPSVEEEIVPAAEVGVPDEDPFATSSSFDASMDEPVANAEQKESFVEEAAPAVPEPEDFSTDIEDDIPTYDAPPSLGDAEKGTPISEAEDGALPWASKPQKDEPSSGWQLDDVLGDVPEHIKPPSLGDIYGDMNNDAPVASGEKQSSDEKLAEAKAQKGTPPWQKLGDKKLSPPTLPNVPMASFEKGGAMGNVIIVAVVLGALYGAYWFLKENDTTAEVIARWTGTLRDVSEELPEEMDDVANNQNAIKPEEMVDLREENPLLDFDQPPEEEMFASADDETMGDPSDMVEDGADESEQSSTIVEFVDVTEDEAQEPIVAGEADEMPEDLSLFASVQKAIMDARKEKESERVKDLVGETGQAELEDENIENIAPSELVRRNAELSEKLEEELKAYREALAEQANPALKPKPDEFFSGKRPQQQSEVLDPPAVAGGAIPVPEPTQYAQQPQEPVYGANPNNLPVVPEPQRDAIPGVRQLADFEAEISVPPEPRVRIPKGVKPRLRATDFPDMHILSLVPNRGVIAHANGKEGVLLIGESLEGWELIGVYTQYAEFSNGKRKHVISLR